MLAGESKESSLQWEWPALALVSRGRVITINITGTSQGHPEERASSSSSSCPDVLTGVCRPLTPALGAIAVWGYQQQRGFAMSQTSIQLLALLLFN